MVSLSLFLPWVYITELLLVSFVRWSLFCYAFCCFFFVFILSHMSFSAHDFGFIIFLLYQQLIEVVFYLGCLTKLETTELKQASWELKSFHWVIDG